VQPCCCLKLIQLFDEDLLNFLVPHEAANGITVLKKMYTIIRPFQLEFLVSWALPTLWFSAQIIYVHHMIDCNQCCLAADFDSSSNKCIIPTPIHLMLVWKMTSICFQMLLLL